MYNKAAYFLRKERTGFVKYSVLHKLLKKFFTEVTETRCDLKKHPEWFSKDDLKFIEGKIAAFNTIQNDIISMLESKDSFVVGISDTYSEKEFNLKEALTIANYFKKVLAKSDSELRFGYNPALVANFLVWFSTNSVNYRVMEEIKDGNKS